MSYKKIFPPELIEPLAWLSKIKWLSLTKSGLEISVDKIREIRAKLHGFDSRFAEIVERIIVPCISEKNPSFGKYIFTYFMASKTLGDGEKILRLSADLCEAFDQTRLDIPFRDYSQPFPTIVVEIPANYVGPNNLNEQGVSSNFVAIHHDRKEQSLLISCVIDSEHGSSWLNCGTDVTIESLFDDERMNILGELELQQAERDRRLFGIAINAMLAMTYGKDWRETQPSKSERVARRTFKKQMRGLGRADREKAQLRFGALPTYFEFYQKIPAFEDHRTPQGQAIMHGCNGKKPHWRKGHWRQQRTGEGRSESTRVWIKPILINSDRFVGDLKDTKVTFTS